MNGFARRLVLTQAQGNYTHTYLSLERAYLNDIELDLQTNTLGTNRS